MPPSLKGKSAGGHDELGERIQEKLRKKKERGIRLGISHKGKKVRGTRGVILVQEKRG